MVNKADLVTVVAQKAAMTKRDAEKAVNAVVDGIQEALSKGDKVSLVGFGTFSVRSREARKGRNPRTGEEIEIGARKIPIFKAGKVLRDLVES